MITVLTKNWKILLPTAIIIVMGLVGVYQYHYITVLKSDLKNEQSEREKDRLVYERNLQQIESESQRLLNEVNAKVMEKERVINEAWNERLNGALKENAELENTITDLSTRADGLLNTIKTIRGRETSSDQRKVEATKTTTGSSTKEWNVLESCIKEYTNMATDADRVIQEFRLLNDWKEIIITEIVE